MKRKNYMSLQLNSVAPLQLWVWL